MSGSPDGKSLISLAKIHLRLLPPAPDALVPESYLIELQKHLEIQPEDTQFFVRFEPSEGFGTLYCLEEGCAWAAIALTKNERFLDGGKSIGFGTLSAYRVHTRSDVHKASRLKRIRGPTLNHLASGSSSPTPGACTPSPKRLSILSALDCVGSPTPSGQASRKRPSDMLPAGRESAVNVGGRLFKQESSPKRFKSEDVDRKGILSPLHANTTSHFDHLNTTQPNSAGTSNTCSQIVKPEPDTSPTPRLESQPNSAGTSNTYSQIVKLEPDTSPTPRLDSRDDYLAEVARRRGSSNSNHSITAYSESSSHGPVASSSRVMLNPSQASMRRDPLYNIMSNLSNDLMGLNDGHEDVRYDSQRNFYGRGRDMFQGPKASPSDLLAFVETGSAGQFDGNISVEKALKKLKLPDLHTPFCNMTISLMPYQVIGVAWMLDKEKTLNGAILADDMGLGKTVQMISTIMANRSDDPAVKSTLIVAPVSLLIQWVDEIKEKTGNALSCLIYHGPSKPRRMESLQDYDVVLTSFSARTLASEWPDPEFKKKKSKSRVLKKDEFIASDSEEDMKAKWELKDKGLLFKMHWHRIVLDEAQNIRNKRTRVSRAVTFLTSKYRWCLTGTPIINGLSDAYPLLRFIQIRPWWDWDEFKAHVFSLQVTDPTLATIKLQAIFAPCLLRRKKDSLLEGKKLIELPPKTIELVQLDFTDEEREVYRMLETRSQQIFNRFLRAGTVLKNNNQVLAMILRLRQVCSHTSLITENDSNYVIFEDINSTVSRKEELFHAQTVLGLDHVMKLKQKLKDVALERMEAEKKSVDASIEEEKCPICNDNLANAVVTPCMHFFCRECLDNVLSMPHVHDAAQDTDPNGRPCPACRAPVNRGRFFSRSLFEPTDEELGVITIKEEAEEDLKPFIKEEAGGFDEDDEMPDISQLISKKGISGVDSSTKNLTKRKSGSGKGKGKAKGKTTKRRARRAVIKSEGEDEDDTMKSEDSLDDFIVQDDEDEEMKDEQKRLRRPRKQKSSGLDSESENDNDYEDDKAIIGLNAEKVGAIMTLPKTLPSTKMMSMMESLLKWREDFPDEKAIVISQWTQCLDLISNYLNTKEIEHVRYQGDMNRDQRDKAVRAFMRKNKRAQVMLMSLKCGGVGLNLTRANRVISMDLGWNEAVESQAFDRVHRLGQERPVFVNRLVIKNTVEDRVLALQEKKKNLADGSLGEGSGKKIERLSVRELANLFGLDIDGRLLKQ